MRLSCITAPNRRHDRRLWVLVCAPGYMQRASHEEGGGPVPHRGAAGLSRILGERVTLLLNTAQQ
jgi:hypothetical protein